MLGTKTKMNFFKLILFSLALFCFRKEDLWKENSIQEKPADVTVVFCPGTFSEEGILFAE